MTVRRREVLVCVECTRDVDTKESEAMYVVTVQRLEPFLHRREGEGRQTFAQTFAVALDRTVTICSRCVGSDVLRRFAPAKDQRVAQ